MANKIDLGSSIIATAPSPATSGTSVTVTTGQANRFPAPNFYATIHPEGTLPTLDTAEIVYVTAVATDTFTIVRAQKGTSAKPITAGWRMTNSVYANDILGLLDILPVIYPVGSIYSNTTSNTNPGTLFGFGTWTAIGGQTLVGYASGDANFGTAGASVGSATHWHWQTIGNDGSGAYFAVAGQAPALNANGNSTVISVDRNNFNPGTRSTAAARFDGTGTASTIQPSLVVYMWQRTA